MQSGVADRSRLYKDLFSEYESSVAPYIEPHPVAVKFGMRLINIDIDRDGVTRTFAWLYLVSSSRLAHRGNRKLQVMEKQVTISNKKI